MAAVGFGVAFAVVVAVVLAPAPAGAVRVIAQVALRLSRRAALNLWRAPLPSLVSMFTIALALCLAASFAFALFGARALLRSFGAEATLTVYLDRSATDAEARSLAAQIAAKNPELDVAYVDRAQALDRLRVDLGDLGSALDGFPRSPLPPSVELRPRGHPPAAALRALTRKLAALPLVSEVDDGREWLDRLEALERALRAFGFGALALVGAAALLVVANTIRLAVYARRDEIEILKLVGATDAYVRAPFLLEGALQGMLGALLAGACLVAAGRLLLPRAAAAFAFAAGVSMPRFGLAHASALVALGTAVGLLGSYLAVARYLKA